MAGAKVHFKNRTDPVTIAAKKRRYRALELRAEGKTFDEIGGELGITRKTAYALVLKAVNERAGEDHDLVKHHVMLQVMRLDKMVRGLWAGAEAGDVESVQAMMRVEERRAKLLGLDAPARITLDVNVALMPTEELMATAARLGVQAVVQGQEDLALPPGALAEPEPVTIRAGEYTLSEPEPL